MSKTRASLDISDLSEFKPKQRKSTEGANTIESLADDAGFRTRHAPPPKPKAKRIDGRTLRRKNKNAQLNIAVTDATRDRFWTMAQDHDLTSGEDLLVQLMDKFEADFNHR